MSMARREMLAGGLLFGALGMATWLTPRTRMNLLGRQDLEALVPENFGAWKSSYDPSLVVPIKEGSLTDTLYDELLTRRYVNAATGAQIYLMIAYGGTQTDALQLHRPETCYPAVGMRIVERERFTLPVAGREIPSVALVAQAPGRTEDIVYWTRMGPRFPQTAGAQRSDKLQLAMKGIIPDGVLIRASLIRDDGETHFEELGAFLSGLVSAVPPSKRAVLIGPRALEPSAG
ncbi:EpsI family protein [Erythrobacter sp. LQ02-29]|uniref:exosortase-associated protein EpsI, V-type n=1 Tax=Erythrobacter sp. LQ02-29 TaxID=2920384 RepID=UPI001F4D9668|nr:exosortase-associated protein EpsI, V-type [Erythrobacter sp. LQ02-29]MCP9222067.1 EpsI family protein [Erythrobacter sp. LQ02-29]